MQPQAGNDNYKGKRALMLLRVSTPIQEERYGWPSQEREIRDKLITALDLKLDEARHIIRDTYTGLEFKQRPALDHILEMAKRGEFDLVCMDVLDRLGRRGLAREIYRMQLREYGVRILTTDPKEHADDDSLIGEMIRLLHGFKAEEELNDIRRRTMNGKWTKALGDETNGRVPRLVGTGRRTYGYQWTYTDKGKRDGLALNYTVVLTEADGTEWTEVTVVIFIFESARLGIPIRSIARMLNEKGIPRPMGGVWIQSTVSDMLRNRTYIGEYYQFKQHNEKVPGKKTPHRTPRPQEEQLMLPVPRIISKELFDEVQERLKDNKKFSSRNNSKPEETLLQGGLGKCGYCGCTLQVNRHPYRWKDGQTVVLRLRYRCGNANTHAKCLINCSIDARLLDAAAWEYVVNIIKDPTQVDKEIAARRSDDPTAVRRKVYTQKLTQVRQDQAALRENLADLMIKRKLDAGTEEFLNRRLHELSAIEDECLRGLASESYEHEQWKKVQDKLDRIHRKCAEMREQLDDPEYSPDHKTKRELCIFFRIKATIYREDHDPRFEITSDPCDILSDLS